MFRFKNKFILKFIFFFSIAILSMALFIQYVLGHAPCNLCLFQRLPYLSSIIIIPLFFILGKFEKIIFIIVLLFFIFGTGVSFYHFGIEQGFFNESFACNLEKSSNSISANELLKELESKTVSCKEITFSFFGFSLATINTIISFIISIIMIINIKNYDKN